jgi:hypothetical protein
MFPPGESHFVSRRPARAGQTTVELMLLISVLVIGLFFVTELFWEPFAGGLGEMQSDVKDIVSDGVVLESQQ